MMEIDFSSLRLTFDVSYNCIQVLCIAECTKCQKKQVVLLASLDARNIVVALGFIATFCRDNKWECKKCDVSSGMTRKTSLEFEDVVASEDFRLRVIKFVAEFRDLIELS